VPINAAAIRAFLACDEAFFHRALRLEQPWEQLDTPLVNYGARCTLDHDLESTPLSEVEGWGCWPQHLAASVRAKLIAEIERRAKIRWADLDADDEATRERAWERLERLALTVGVDAETWERVVSGDGPEEEE
jgi:hypothetical protein